MGQVLKILLFLGIAGWLLFRVRRALSRPDPADNESTAESGNAMSACAICGMFVPDDEIIRAQGKTYCCIEHRDQDTPA